MNLMSIGFTKTSAQHFFDRLIKAGVKRVIDVRLHNQSQLAGFAKSADLRYFLKVIGNIDYVHEPLLAPTPEMLSAYRKKQNPWDTYETQYRTLIEQRQIESKLDQSLYDQACLLCSEDKPHKCHRRLVAEYLREKWEVLVQVQHL